jgi:Xaa-Pro aminopeptidase
MLGLSPAFPLLGGTRRLSRNDIIFVDAGFSYGGYYTDMTRIFCLSRPSQAAADAHALCLQVQEAVRRRLKPGAVPGEIYEEVYETVIQPQGTGENFMGFGSNQVPFLGHGIGLVVDEFPAIAKKIRVPLEKNMVIAVEPKKGLPHIGLVGIENTFLVTEQGGEKVTIGGDEIIVLSP